MSAEMVRVSAHRNLILTAFVKHIAATEEEPVDPLQEAIWAVVEDFSRYDCWTREQTQLLRGELEKRGLEIREIGK